MLLQLKVADFPTMKKEPRQKLHKSLHRQAFPKVYDPKEQELTIKELGAKLGEIVRGSSG